jgi:hypothetical protein
MRSGATWLSVVRMENAQAERTPLVMLPTKDFHRHRERLQAAWRSSSFQACKPRCFFWIATRPSGVRKDDGGLHQPVVGRSLRKDAWRIGIILPATFFCLPSCALYGLFCLHFPKKCFEKSTG